MTDHNLTSCLCPYKESEIPENDTSHFRVAYNFYSAPLLKTLRNKTTIL